MRVTDMFLAVPQLILALALAQLMGPSLQSAMLALTRDLLAVLHPHRLCRGPAPAVSLFIDALQCIGARGPRILFLHILPNCISPIIVAPPSAWASPSWSPPCSASSAWAPRRPIRTGASPSRKAAYLPDAWWFSTFPGLAIFLTVLGFNLLGDGLRDIVDPRLRRSR